MNDQEWHDLGQKMGRVSDAILSLQRMVAEQLPSGVATAFGPITLGATPQAVRSVNRAFRYLLVQATGATVYVGTSAAIANGATPIATVNPGAPMQIIAVGLRTEVWLSGNGATVSGFYSDSPIGAMEGGLVQAQLLPGSNTIGNVGLTGSLPSKSFVVVQTSSTTPVTLDSTNSTETFDFTVPTAGVVKSIQVMMNCGAVTVGTSPTFAAKIQIKNAAGFLSDEYLAAFGFTGQSSLPDAGYVNVWNAYLSGSSSVQFVGSMLTPPTPTTGGDTYLTPVIIPSGTAQAQVVLTVDTSGSSVAVDGLALVIEWD